MNIEAHAFISHSSHCSFLSIPAIITALSHLTRLTIATEMEELLSWNTSLQPFFFSSVKVQLLYFSQWKAN
jgi:hypothetical protein